MADDILNTKMTFKAWLEQQGEGKKLHVHGKIHVSDESLQYQLDKKMEQGYFPDELYLEIKPEPVSGTSEVEIKYHEDLKGDQNYKKITLFAKSVEVYQITEIAAGKE